jgi:hypothetical protein
VIEKAQRAAELLAGLMMAKRNPGGQQPWQLATEDALRDRPGIMWVSLLTDEIGCAWLARGEVPAYLKRQAEDALEWCATEERGVVKLPPKAQP